MARKTHERGVFLAVGVFDADGGASVARPRRKSFPVNHAPQRTTSLGGVPNRWSEEICKTGMHECVRLRESSRAGRG